MSGSIEKTSKLSAPIACRHLGLADDPFHHGDTLSDEHRCYLWMQRDRIDPDHQKGYCLSGRYRDCPWLQISLPSQPRLKGVWREAIVRNVDATWPHVRRGTAAGARATAATASKGIEFLALWARENLPRAMGWLRRELLSLARVVAAGVARGSSRVTSTILRVRRRVDSRTGSPVAAESDDFGALMRLGREASRAGHREQAHLCFAKASSLNPVSEDAWLWTAATTEESREAQACLERALAINPTSGRARAQLADAVQRDARPARPGRGAVRVGATAPKLLKKGIAALDAGNEDEAHQLFTSATEMDKSNEAAWFWRAKTATDLGVVISCLERVLQLNPRNEKAKSNLDWAMERQRANLNRTRVPTDLSSRPIVPALYAKGEPAPRSFLLQVSSAAYMCLGVLWVGPAILPALDGSLASLYLRIGILPSLQIPYFSSSLLISESPLPEFNILYLVPLTVAAFSFVAMEAVWNGHRTVSLYLAMVAAGSIVTMGIFGTGPSPSIFLMAISVAAGVSALGGRIDWRRRGRALAGQGQPGCSWTTI
ncbi:MAG: tetratricopeptide repeat protein [Dehalococcoidia bacterium]|nr:tetratricopeptide repeat protein [Dehalococcoidia bacterium]